jgi:hypothetical protein
MPFKSEKQRRYLFANEPEVAKKFAKDYNMGGVASMFRKRLADGDDPFYDAWKKVYETNPDAASMNEKHDEYLEKYTLEMSTQTSEAPTEDVEQTADPMLNLFSETDALNNDQALTTLFAKEEPQGIMAAKGGRIGFRGGGQDASSDDFGGSTSSGDQGETSSDSGFGGGDTSSSNDNNGGDNGYSVQDDIEDYATNVGKEANTTGGGFKDDGGDTYKDPIIDMVGKKVVVDPTTGGNIVVDKNSVLMKERKLKMSKGKRPAAWVSPTEKQYFDNLDDYIDSKTGFFSKYNAEKFLVNQIKSKIPIIGSILPTIYPSKNINFKSTSKYEVPGSDLGFYDPDEYPEFWGKGPDDNEPDGDAYPVIPGVIDDTNEEFIDFSLMSALDKIRANQARRKGLVEDDIIQDNETIVDNEIMTANKGGLAGLFKVKTQ